MMCGPPATTTGWRSPGLIHTANFTGILTITTLNIYYIFGNYVNSTYCDMSLEHGKLDFECYILYYSYYTIPTILFIMYSYTLINYL